MESPTKDSVGRVRQQTTGDDFPADSFFDVFVEIQTPLGTLHNEKPVRLEATVDSLPSSTPSTGREVLSAYCTTLAVGRSACSPMELEGNSDTLGTITLWLREDLQGHVRLVAGLRKGQGSRA